MIRNLAQLTFHTDSKSLWIFSLEKSLQLCGRAAVPAPPVVMQTAPIAQLPTARIAQTIGVAANALIADSARGVAQTVAVEVYPAITDRTRGISQAVSVKVHTVITNTAAGVSQCIGIDINAIVTNATRSVAEAI